MNHPKKTPLQEPLENNSTDTPDYFTIFQRNIGFYTQAQQNVLKKSTVLIAGTGGVGSPCAEILVRMGIGRLILAEFDVFSISNVNRQIPATINNVGQHKAQVLAAHLKGIHPFSEIEVVAEGITVANVDQLVARSDIVISAVDSCMFMVLQQALKRNQKMGLTASPLIDKITMTAFPPNGYYFSDIYPFEVNEANLQQSNAEYYAFVEVMSRQKLFEAGYFPVICAGTFTSAGMISYQVAEYLILKSVFFPCFPSYALFDARRIEIKIKFRYLKVVFKILKTFPILNNRFVKTIRSKVTRRQLQQP